VIETDTRTAVRPCAKCGTPMTEANVYRYPRDGRVGCRACRTAYRIRRQQALASGIPYPPRNGKYENDALPVSDDELLAMASSNTIYAVAEALHVSRRRLERIAFRKGIAFQRPMRAAATMPRPATDSAHACVYVPRYAADDVVVAMDATTARTLEDLCLAVAAESHLNYEVRRAASWLVKAIRMARAGEDGSRRPASAVGAAAAGGNGVDNCHAAEDDPTP